jgi:hypothetical protein
MNHLALAGLARLIFAWSEPSLPPPTPAETGHEQQAVRGGEHAQSAQSNTVTETAATVVNQPTPTQTAQQGETASSKDSKKSSFDYNALAVSIFTGVLALLGWLQWRTTREQARYMNLTKQSYEIGERARLVFEKLEFLHVYDDWIDIKFRFDLSNTGRTAGDVIEQHWTLLDSFAEGESLPKEPPYDAAGEGHPTYFTVAAGRSLNKTAIFPKIMLNNFWEVRHKKRPLYLVGFVRYKDAFGEQHVSRLGIRYWQGHITYVTDIPGYNVDA